MKLTKRQIQKIKTALIKAENAECRFSIATGNLASVIIGVTKVEGNVNYLSGDGFGFTPESNNDTHIAVRLLIELAEKGTDINEGVILKYLSL